MIKQVMKWIVENQIEPVKYSNFTDSLSNITEKEVDWFITNDLIEEFLDIYYPDTFKTMYGNESGEFYIGRTVWWLPDDHVFQNYNSVFDPHSMIDKLLSPEEMQKVREDIGEMAIPLTGTEIGYYWINCSS